MDVLCRHFDLFFLGGVKILLTSSIGGLAVDVKWNGPLYPFNIGPGMHVYTRQPFIFNSLIW